MHPFNLPQEEGAASRGVALLDDQAIALDRILREQSIDVVFQPIADLRSRSVYGFEALVRGPRGSPLHQPLALFSAARQAGRLAELDELCVRRALATFADLRLPGLLFLNVTQTLFDQGFFSALETLQWIERLGLAPSRIVLEVLEDSDLQDDTRAFHEAQNLHQLGFALALDDLGQGFGRMRLWKSLRPRYLKIDREFIDGVAGDSIKTAFVRSILVMAEATHSWVIAEGVENLHDLQALRRMGVAIAQGWAISKPSPRPPSALPSEVLQVFDEALVLRNPLRAAQSTIEKTALQLLKLVRPVQPQEKLNEVLYRFEADADLMSVPVVDAHGVPKGILNRYMLADLLWRPYVRDLYGNKPCARVMSNDVLQLELRASLHQAIHLISDASFRHATEGVLVTEEGRYRGLLLIGDLLRLVTEFQLQFARYANPLTQLPGNVPIDDYIDVKLEQEEPFVVAYGDLDHFKPFNDRFGYKMGDELIELVADLLKSEFCKSDDFIGHIGGDDFVLVLPEDGAVARIERVQDRFAQEVLRFFDAQTIAAGGYVSENRRGEVQFFPLPVLSFGVLLVSPHAFASHREIAAVMGELKKLAKSQQGRHLFVDRRRYSAPVAEKCGVDRSIPIASTPAI